MHPHDPSIAGRAPHGVPLVPHPGGPAGGPRWTHPSAPPGHLPGPPPDRPPGASPGPEFGGFGLRPPGAPPNGPAHPGAPWPFEAHVGPVGAPPTPTVAGRPPGPGTGLLDDELRDDIPEDGSFPDDGEFPAGPDSDPVARGDEAGQWRSAGGHTPPLPPVPPGPPGLPGAPPGGPGFGGPGFGGPGPFGGFAGPGHRRGAARVRRGDVRAAILALLAEQPRNGYQLIREITRRSGGVWRPSPGSVYPALSQLADEELVQESGDARRREFALTDAGRSYAAEHPDELAAPFENAAEAVSGAATQLWQSLGAVHAAATQVVQAGTPEAVDAAQRVLDTARRDIYRILAGDADESD